MHTLSQTSLPKTVRDRRGLRSKNQLAFYTNLSRLGGEVVPYRSFEKDSWLLNHPRWVKHVLVQHRDCYDHRPHPFRQLKPIVSTTGRLFLGLDLDQPRERWKELRRQVEGWTKRLGRRWSRLTGQGEPLEVAYELDVFNIRLMSSLLFDVEVSFPEAERFVLATNWVEETLVSQSEMQSPDLASLPQELRDRYALALAAQREFAALLLSRQHRVRESTSTAPDTDPRIEPTVRTLLNSALATALTWTLHLLARHPTVQDSLVAEAEAFHDQENAGLGHLAEARTVILESMRLFPPVWLFHRHAIRDDKIHGINIQTGDLVGICTYTLHRHPSFWEKPDSFRPDRFCPRQVAQRSRFLFLPFGIGPRSCAAGHMATQVMQLILARLTLSFRLLPLPGNTPEPQGMVALQPHPEVLLNLVPRP